MNGAHRQPGWRTALPAAALAVLAGCLANGPRTTPAVRDAASAAAPLPRPEGCRDVRPDEPLQAVVDAAAEGAAVCLLPGVHAGPLVVGKPLTLWGPRAASVRTGGKGNTVTVLANRVSLLGFTVDGSGGHFDTTDSAVKVQGDDVRVEGLRIERAVFGITVEKSNRALVRRNSLQGDQGDAMGLRGDSVRLWEVRASLVEGNDVEDGRDVVVWYSPGNTIRNNVIRRGRYGTHFMYSSDSVVEGNRYEGNVVGVFVMYSRNIRLEDNVIADCAGAAGMGLGVKESGNLTVKRNRFVHDLTALFLDTSPLYDDDRNVFEQNEFRLGEVGVLFHAHRAGNAFRGNLFRDNQAQVVVEGGGGATDTLWEANAWDDYAGYDLDRDGVGDLPYELRSLSGELKSRYPDLRLFNGLPALSVIDALSRLVPLYAPELVLADARPRMDLEVAGKE